MTTGNPFDLLGDNEDDPSLFIAAVELQKSLDLIQQKKDAAEAAREAERKKAQDAREAARGSGRGYGYGRRYDTGYKAPRGHASNNASSEGYVSKPYAEREWEQKNDRSSYRGPLNFHRGGFVNGVSSENGHPRKEFDRHNNTAYRNDVKRDGSGRSNWGSTTDEITQVIVEPINENGKNVNAVKAVSEEGAEDSKKDSPATEKPEFKPVPVDNSMTLKEYQKILKEKRLALLSRNSEERKVVVDKDLKAMQPLSSKKTNNEIFAKLGPDKIKTKEVVVKEEKVKKTLSLNPSCYPRQQFRNRGRDSREGHPDKANAAPIKDNGHIPKGDETKPEAPPVDDCHYPSLGGE